ncbi:MAG: glycosyltransferase family 39 protein [bacterium]|nr:glycosyltransferase family 39 protein [bacterium]
MLKKECIIIAVILFLGAFFRFYDLGKTPPGLYPDEAMNGNNALEAIYSNDIGVYSFKIFYPENNGREGFFINLQAISVAVFGNTPWALRVVSALFGTLTILGLYLLTKELFKNTAISLLSSFFLAISFWHINFSRIGFRAIMVPFLSVFALYFLLKGIRGEKIWDFIWAGVFTGLGLQTYIAFRFVPFVILIPLLWYATQSVKRKAQSHNLKLKTKILHIALFLVTALIIFLPLGLYFLQNPQDFLGRGGQVSIFSAQSPIKEFLKSNLLTLQMFFFKGDCNWRHNLACQPQLNPIVAIFFLIGLILSLKSVLTKSHFVMVLTDRSLSDPLAHLVLLCWILFLSLPATLTREGLPHALRSIGMIPPVMILAGLGCWWVLEKIDLWLENQKKKWPAYKNQLERLNKEIVLLVLVVFLAITYTTYRDYFVRWANNPNTYFAFSTDLWNLGKYLDGLPEDVHKYIIVNSSGTEVRGIPMPAQTVMFATNSFAPSRKERNFTYVGPDQIDRIFLAENKKAVIAFLNGDDRDLIFSVQKKFPELRVRVPGDFVILE